MDELLFCNSDLGSDLQNHERKMFEEIDKIEENRLLSTSVDDLCAYFEQEYVVEALEFDESKIQVDQSETQVDVSKDPDRFIRDRSRPFYIRGTNVSYFIPYQGDRNLFHCTASTRSYNPPRASITQT